MARRAIKDTFALEVIGDIEVRRQIVAGQEVPDHYILEDEDAVEGYDKAGIGVAPAYKDDAITRRVVREEGRTVVKKKPGTVDRVENPADRPLAEGEPELAEANNPLRQAKLAPGETAAKVAEKADKEQQEAREREQESSQFERLEERLDGGKDDEDGEAKPRRSRRAKPADKPQAEGETEAK